MASFEEHCHDCERLLGDRYEEVNIWIDALFDRLGPIHRYARHHTRGIAEAQKRFGCLAGRAAMIHILKDCGHVPTARDWEEGIVDDFGMKRGVPFKPWDAQTFDEAARSYLDKYKKRR